MTLDVLTWHVHGAYQQSLSRVAVRWILPVASGRPGYGGRSAGFDWPANVIEVPVEELPAWTFDVVVYQHRQHYDVDRLEVLTAAQRAAPVVYIEHDPPRMSPTDTVHPVTEGATVVHVTPFNALMWDTRAPWTVIDHGVPVPTQVASLRRPSGIVVINELAGRGRRLGLDVFVAARRQIPLELIGIGATELGGRGEVPPGDVTATVAEHRFLFSPIRYTSLGLGILEAMAAGVPVVGLATTELPTVVRSGIEGFVDTDPQRVIEGAQRLVASHALALELGANARGAVETRFGLDRFVKDWHDLLVEVAAGRPIS
jgi:hypothetical protein